MTENENNTSEIIDSYEGYDLYKESYGDYTAECSFSLFVDHISFFDGSYCIELKGDIVNYSDWEDCQDEIEKALEVVEHFQEVIGDLQYLKY